MRALVQLFRFLLRVQGAVVTGANIVAESDEVEIEVRRRRSAAPRCPNCGRAMGGAHRPRRHRWRHLDMMGIRAFVVAEIREGRCRTHGRMVESVPWAAHRSKHTKAFDLQVARLAQVADRSAVSRMFTVAWRTVGGMIARVVAAAMPADIFNEVTAIGVDEIAHKRAHRYLTVVMCLHTGKVLWVGEGKSAETLGKCFEAMGAERARKIELVAMDMSAAFAKAVKEHAPQADIVYDRFHVVKLLLEAVDEVRRAECRRLGNSEARSAVKGMRFALFRNPKHLTPEDRTAITAAVSANRRLARVYELRVSFEDLWNCRSEKDARRFLKRWTTAALRSRMESIRTFARTVRSHLQGILAFFRWYGQTNAILEGTNNKIRLLIHRAFGFRSDAALIAMVHLCCSRLDLSKAA